MDPYSLLNRINPNMDKSKLNELQEKDQYALSEFKMNTDQIA